MTLRAVVPRDDIVMSDAMRFTAGTSTATTGA